MTAQISGPGGASTPPALDNPSTPGVAVRESILAFIAGYYREVGLPPTVREIAAHVDRSISTVHDHLRRLERDGRIQNHGKRGVLIVEAA